MATDELQLNVARHLDVGRRVHDVASGGSACLMIDAEDKSVWSWGYGFLGRGPSGPELCEVPGKIPDPVFGRNEYRGDVRCEKVFAGLHHFAVVTNKGDLFAWGANRGGCLGLGVKERNQYFPMRVRVNGFLVWIVM
jgi:alpha-tubulin suppressor-like RCC1 family protein